MKRIICIILFIVLSFILCGCSSDEEKFPQLRICRSVWRADNIYIPLRDNHNFNIHYLYDEVETENGYDIVVHVVRD